ncbi:hypothetical protein CTEN210_04889 [Chaetoceros tenuissimus]|uniref:Uncharacterized protein n=1 Tax=Chaetoceros tenuissimus TaxID=426638 RepID=A0AAD3CM21_9STRA|nr:hypothetical protein CTEN210_04889 [Chaetoceros tenuissimus]
MNARSAFLVFMLLYLNQSTKAVTNAPYHISNFVKRPIAFQIKKLSCLKQSLRDKCGSESKSKYLCSFLMNPLHKFEREEEACLGTWTEVDEIEFTNEDEIEEEVADDKYDNGQDEFIYEIDYENYVSEKKKTHTSKALHKIKEHPLRTDEWLVQVKFRKESELFPSLPRKFFRKDNNRDDKTRTIQQIFKFSDNGYVILVEDPNDGSERDAQIENYKEKRSIFNCNPRYLFKNYNDSRSEEIKEKKSKRVTKVGTWKMNTNGVSFSIPVRVQMLEDSFTPKLQTKTQTVYLHYHADVHLSKFQDQPRMFRGVITRDRLHGHSSLHRKDLFRPVVGQFCAKGIGMDSLDTSYKSRGVGLKPGNA